jgi:hypothetical protein
MFTGRLIFKQVMDFIPLSTFHRCVTKYQGNSNVKTFTCLDQFLCMAFAQITHRESLRDIEICLRSQNKKLYHMGIRGRVSRSTLADANEKRDWRIYAELAQHLIAIARDLYREDQFLEELDETVYALDSTTIDLCLSVFPWAVLRKKKGAVKLHTLLDLRGNIPTFIHISDGKLHDVNALDLLPLETGAYYVMDRGYLDFQRLYTFNRVPAFFVTRAKANTQYKRRYSHTVDKTTGLRCDQTITLSGYPSVIQSAPVLSRHSASREISRCGHHTDTCFSHQQFLSTRINNSSAVSKPMAGRAVFQMDQATFEDKTLFGHLRECGEDSGLDSSLRLCPGSHYEKTAQPHREPLHNFTDFKCYLFRKSTLLSTCYRDELQKPRPAWL